MVKYFRNIPVPFFISDKNWFMPRAMIGLLKSYKPPSKFTCSLVYIFFAVASDMNYAFEKREEWENFLRDLEFEVTGIGFDYAHLPSWFVQGVVPGLQPRDYRIQFLETLMLESRLRQIE